MNDHAQRWLDRVREELERVHDIAWFSYGPCGFDMLLSSQMVSDADVWRQVGSLPREWPNDAGRRPDDYLPEERKPFWCDPSPCGRQCTLWRGDSRTAAEIQRWGDAAFATLAKCDKLPWELLETGDLAGGLARGWRAGHLRGWRGLLRVLCSVALQDLSQQASNLGQETVLGPVDGDRGCHGRVAERLGGEPIPTFQRIELYSDDCLYLCRAALDLLLGTPSGPSSFVDRWHKCFVFRGEPVQFPVKHAESCLLVLELLTKANGERLTRKDLVRLSAKKLGKPEYVDHVVNYIRGASRYLEGECLIDSTTHGYRILPERLQ